MVISACWGVRWIERECGWGSCGDGFSFRKDEAAVVLIKKVVSNYTSDVALDGYCVPHCDPRLIEVSNWGSNRVDTNGDMWLAHNDVGVYKNHTKLQ